MDRFLAYTVALAAALVVPCAAAQQLSPEQKEALLWLQARYAGAVRSAVVSELDGLPLRGNGACTVELTQLPSGQIVHVVLSDCEYPEDLQLNLMTQLESASLPYYGFEAVFQRKIKVRLVQPSLSGAAPNNSFKPNPLR